MVPPQSTKLRRRPGLAILFLLAVGLVAIAMQAAATSAAGSVSGLPKRSSLLFALNGENGSLVGAKKAGRDDRFTLTLRGLGATTTWFADRPRRDAGRLRTPDLFSGWGKLGFKADPPNAALVVNDGGRTRTMAVELRLRRYQARIHTARFDVRSLGSLGGGLDHLNAHLEPRLPSHFQAPSLFIDNGEFEPNCTLGETQLFAIDPARSVTGMTPADGRQLKIAENPQLFAVYGNRFGGNGETTFALPNLPAPAGSTWYVCSVGFYPQPEHLTPGCRLGQTAFWALPFAITDPQWLPADGRSVSTSTYSEYGAAYAPLASGFDLPKVTAPPGLTALTCVKPSYRTEPSLGSLDLFPGQPPAGGAEWEPARGQTISSRVNLTLNALLEGNPGAPGRVPEIGPVAPGANYFIAASGGWPLS